MRRCRYRRLLSNVLLDSPHRIPSKLKIFALRSHRFFGIGVIIAGLPVYGIAFAVFHSFEISSVDQLDAFPYDTGGDMGAVGTRRRQDRGRTSVKLAVAAVSDGSRMLGCRLRSGWRIRPVKLPTRRPAKRETSFPRGTDGSNPSPSSGESSGTRDDPELVTVQMHRVRHPVRCSRRFHAGPAAMR